MPRPADAAPGGMHGATRMHDPSEAAHDRVRRRWMNLAFVAIAIVNFLDWWLFRVRGVEWLRVSLVVVAAMPLAMAIKVFELRFKMATQERSHALRELPSRKKAEFLAYAILILCVFALNAERWSWALLGVWAYDFFTYYHDRPERIRHLYAVTKTLDELREFPAPWAWTLPALGLEIIRRITS